MRIGVPKEIKDHEYRAGLTPGSVAELTARGHDVLVETNAGAGIGFSDAQYQRVGARIVAHAKQVFDAADLITHLRRCQPQAARLSYMG